ncbi:BON domain-containing protein [Novispirillum itersonii]|uniref:BON domain-containing protein n=1 Tax=Novispirillum itersonii TaxID=189 RepID=UPI00036A4062|nr:BON domain-containing protein [Novispirillum itersonii]
MKGSTAFLLLRLLSVLPLVPVSACTPLGVAVSAVTTVGSAAIEERGVDGTANDAAIKAGITGRFFQTDSRLLSDVDVTVFERRVLLMGIVSDPEMKSTAVRLSREDPDVTLIHDYIKVRADSSVDLARDVSIASELRSSLMFDSRVFALNYNIDVVDRTVYVIGLAQTAEERERVLDWCRSTEYVRQVVDLIWMKNDPRRRKPSDRRPL